MDTERQLREAAAELHEAGQSEAQRRASQLSDLSLLLPPRVLLILTQGIASLQLIVREWIWIGLSIAQSYIVIYF